MISSLTIGLISAGCIFGGALLGLLLQGLLPEGHLRDTSKDTVKVAAGMIATVSALVLGLLVGSAKSSFDATSTAMIQNGAKIILLDRALAAYGPETKGARDQLRRAVIGGIEMFWPEEEKLESGMTAFERANAMEMIQAKLRNLTPATDAQRSLQSQAEQISSDLLQARWLLIEQAQSTLPLPFLIVLLFWLTMLHLSFGLFAPRNTTALTVLLISAFSVSAAIFIILEMNHPLQGMIKVSSAPMRKALEHLNQ
jgi:Protein of unknown function (DUF4239)